MQNKSMKFQGTVGPLSVEDSQGRHVDILGVIVPIFGSEYKEGDKVMVSIETLIAPQEMAPSVTMAEEFINDVACLSGECGTHESA